MKYTDEQIIEYVEAASKLLNTSLPFCCEATGKFSTERLKNLGPCAIPCRRIFAEFVCAAFDNPDDLAIIVDDTPNGKQIGTKTVVHKKWEYFIRRNLATTTEVFKENGFSIGNPDDDKFIPMDKILSMQKEVEKRLKKEFGAEYPM